MEQSLSPFQSKLVAAEELFFTWLLRVIAAALLVGSAWIDDAPPLSLGAVVIAIYVLLRALTNINVFISAAPFKSNMNKILFALVALVLLMMSFATVVIFTDRIASAVAG
ncbi:MAG: hypothetical protein OXU24_05875 [Gammaproteobacteria bacterium]|nr:hypothetical protein [Gammaproteobacteria bacterium]